MNPKIRGLIRLTRWQEYLPYVFPLTTLGALLAVRATGGQIDLRLAVAILANFLVVAYAFMINDIEDAPDDAREAARAARNPITNGELSPREGWIASLAVAALTVALYATLGTAAFLVGMLTLALSHFYSWKVVRLKAYPITDVISHSLMLSGLLVVVGYFVYHNDPGAAWIVILAMTLVSVYGQLYNQIRDFDMDKAAGLRNTALTLGRGAAQAIMYGMLILAGGLLVYAFASGIIPTWVALVPLVTIPLFFFFVRPSGDMRGTEAADVSGKMQVQTILIYNLTMAVWLAAVVFRLVA